ncbi:hypothetical protein B566_EDAN012594 [Ephemera danica]|nr:hypothetical protein B566_EDAN012594 [Ephemera danica]
MGGRGRGRGGGPRLNPEQFGLPKEEDPHIDVTPPLLFPPRPPLLKPLTLTDPVLNMLEVGQSIKETILHKMETGDFHEKLVLPQELVTHQGHKKKSKKKKAKKVNMSVLDDLQAREENADDASDAEPGGEGESSESAEEHDSDDSGGSDDEDEEMDEGNDYCHDYYNEEDEQGPDDDDDYNEAMA